MPQACAKPGTQFSPMILLKLELLPGRGLGPPFFGHVAGSCQLPKTSKKCMTMGTKKLFTYPPVSGKLGVAPQESVEIEYFNLRQQPGYPRACAVLNLRVCKFKRIEERETKLAGLHGNHHFFRRRKDFVPGEALGPNWYHFFRRRRDVFQGRPSPPIGIISIRGAGFQRLPNYLLVGAPPDKPLPAGK